MRSLDHESSHRLHPPGNATGAPGHGRLGHRVYAGVRSREHAHGLRQRRSDRMVPVFLDVTDQAQIDAVAGQIAGGGGSLDGVVNNAGIGRGGAAR